MRSGARGDTEGGVSQLLLPSLLFGGEWGGGEGGVSFPSSNSRRRRGLSLCLTAAKTMSEEPVPGTSGTTERSTRPPASSGATPDAVELKKRKVDAEAGGTTRQGGGDVEAPLNFGSHP